MAIRPIDLEAFRTRGDGRLPGYLGIRVVEMSEGLAHLEFTVKAELIAPNGYLHAGSVVSLADTACGYGCIAHLPEGAEGFTTVELKANMLGTAREGIVRAIARPVHLGRTTQVWDATCHAGDSDRPMALFRCTQMILYPKAAKSPAG